MRQRTSVALANWLLRHLVTGPYSESLSGDLSEELHSGRSVVWYWRQILCAIAVRVFSKSRNYMLPFAFSAAWSVLYPAWDHYIWRSLLAQSFFDRWLTLAWPYSASLELGRGILPAATFIWLGSLLFLFLRTQRTEKQLGFRILRSLSLSLNVLLLTSIGLVGWFGLSGNLPHPVAREIVPPWPYPVGFSGTLALSLFSAILSALPPRRNRRGSAPRSA